MALKIRGLTTKKAKAGDLRWYTRLCSGEGQCSRFKEENKEWTPNMLSNEVLYS